MINFGSTCRRFGLKFRWAVLLSAGMMVAIIAMYCIFPRFEQPNPSSGLFVNELGMEFVWIPAGNHTVVLRRRNDFADEADLTVETRTVPIDGFWISKYELTQEQVHRLNGYYFSTFPGPLLPLENIGSKDVDALCERLKDSANKHGLNVSYRLPNELEWEFACYASPEDELLNLSTSEATQLAWFDVNSRSRTHEVGKLRPNSRGLHDMYGNVWEICETGPDEFYDNGLFGYGTVAKGGSWNSPLPDGVHWNRHLSSARDPVGIIGIRLVMVQERPLSDD
jgi:formylglycine-generating enzyme required for sulfatase activity